MRIWIVVGTRPEVIKQVPVYWACRERFGADAVKLIGTGQHKELLQQALDHFETRLDANFAVMKAGQSLNVTASSILARFDDILTKDAPDWIIVQGDTTTAAMAAIAAFHRQIKVAHNEAGLRSYDLQNPFPEEANRRWIGQIARLHLAPTTLARDALLREGVAADRIHVTGNSGVDSLYWTLARAASPRAQELRKKAQDSRLRLVLMTAHRRENAEAVDAWFGILAKFLEERQDLMLVYPLHPNNLARPAAEKWLAKNPRVELCDPLDYLTTCQLLQSSAFSVTDSGGIQEESASLGIPVVVCRKTTERMEAIHAGLARLADPADPAALRTALEWADDQARKAPTKVHSVPNSWGPYGDGRAGVRIAELLG